MYDDETDTRPRHWSDGIETRPRHSKNAPRPSLSDVQHQDYSPALYWHQRAICLYLAVSALQRQFVLVTWHSIKATDAVVHLTQPVNRITQRDQHLGTLLSCRVQWPLTLVYITINIIQSAASSGVNIDLVTAAAAVCMLWKSVCHARLVHM